MRGSTDFIFTYFPKEPPDEEDYAKLQVMAREADYMICGNEVCESTGRLHWQGYIMFRRPTSEFKVRSMMGQAHIEIMSSSRDQCISYCMKEGMYAIWSSGRELRS